MTHIFRRGFGLLLAVAAAVSVVGLGATPALAAGDSPQIMADVFDSCADTGTLYMSLVVAEVDNGADYALVVKELGLSIGGISDFDHEVLITGSMSTPTPLASSYDWELDKIDASGKSTLVVASNSPVTHTCSQLSSVLPTALPTTSVDLSSPTAAPPPTITEGPISVTTAVVIIVVALSALAFGIVVTAVRRRRADAWTRQQ
ncbi:MAG TPA: hypothetical protein VLE99_06730 [Candidatus Saccharimonadales bacterium]|nr:hypothetical protein [Candidatus Saccharimonadales bacterium]